MLKDLYRWLPPEAVKILLTLFLSFLVGLEREEHKASGNENYSFGGVRTFPLIGLLGYSLAFLSAGQLFPLAAGFVVIGGFLMLSYRNKVSVSGMAGMTSEMSGLLTYLVGALIYGRQYWVAITLCVANMLLLELKAGLEGLTKRIAPEEIFTFTKFLLLTAVILPILPNAEIGRFQINPFKTWLVVVAVSGVSYGSYAIQKLTAARRGLILAAILGGAYSSTVTTVVLAKRAARENRPHLISGVTLIASAVMYLRLGVLLALFNRDLMIMLGPSFAVLAGGAIVVGWLWSRRPDVKSGDVEREYEPGNPLELRAAFLFALVFLATLIATHAVTAYLGKAGLYALAAVMGLSVVDPFVMSMTQSAGSVTHLSVAAAAILIVAASNNLVKGICAFAWSDRKTGMLSLGLLGLYAALGLAPLLWL